MVDACRSLVERAGIARVEVGQADLAQIPSLGEPADLVVAINAVLSSLHHGRPPPSMPRHCSIVAATRRRGRRRRPAAQRSTRLGPVVLLRRRSLYSSDSFQGTRAIGATTLRAATSWCTTTPPRGRPPAPGRRLRRRRRAPVAPVGTGICLAAVPLRSPNPLLVTAGYCPRPITRPATVPCDPRGDGAPMRVVVTGGAGFVGRTCVERSSAMTAMSITSSHSMTCRRGSGQPR